MAEILVDRFLLRRMMPVVVKRGITRNARSHFTLGPKLQCVQVACSVTKIR